MMKSINPFNGEQLEVFEASPDASIDKILALHEKTLVSGKEMSMAWRAERLNAAAEILETKKSIFAKRITLEMGKLLSESKAEIEKCAWVCRYYATNGPTFLEEQEIATEAKKSVVCYRPLGNILAIMPWNFPFWQVFRFAAPTLMAGNTCLLKHAASVSRCALLIEQIFKEAGFPPGYFSTLILENERVARLIGDRRVHAVSLTGSGAAGRAVASQAAHHLKKSVLELGGSDPYIVLKDADIEAAAAICASARMLNAGQSCIGAKRFIVDKAVFEEFVESFVGRMMAYRMGDPLQSSTSLAPLASAAFCETLHAQVAASLANGYRLICGGYRPHDLSPAFYPGTVMVGGNPDAPAYREELFGPAATIFRAADEIDAFRIANDTVFGLGAAIFTTDEEKALDLAKNHLDTGCCFINGQVKSDPRLPFGGIKESGFGRELGKEGIYEFTNVKTVYLA